MDIAVESPFACNMSALEPEARSRHLSVIRQLFGAVMEVRELSDGYAFVLPNETDAILLAGEFVANERLCCPFFGFTLHLEPEGGSFSFRLTGRKGVKPFIHAEVGEYLSPAAPKPNGFDR
jgi:hypothetical protein